LDGALHAVIAGIPWLAFNGWIVGALVLGAAGAFQFSALKYHCLDKCRTPLSFVIEHWRGTAARRQALLLGVHHGLFCVGCCWAIMLLLFVVGTGSVGWMLALGAVMAIEKNAPWGRRLSTPLGSNDTRAQCRSLDRLKRHSRGHSVPTNTRHETGHRRSLLR
jgi:predicted metal-binding membrane protein